MLSRTSKAALSFFAKNPWEQNTRWRYPEVLNRSYIKIKIDHDNNSLKPQNSKPECKIVYDGNCPVCKVAVKGLNLSKVELINARNGEHTLVQELEEKGYDLDKGLVMVSENRTVHHGAEAIKAAAHHKGGFLNYLFNSSFSDSIYPFFRGIRNLFIGETIAEQRVKEKFDKNTKPPMSPS